MTANASPHKDSNVVLTGSRCRIGPAYGYRTRRAIRGNLALTRGAASRWAEDYRHWFAGLKQRAVASANRELVALYWQIGSDILDRQQKQGWGAGVVDQLARDLKAAFPDMRGFSPRNLKYMRALAQAFPQPEFVQQPVAQLPWSHVVTLFDKLDDTSQRL